jgi:hypothetical protein
MDVIEPDSAPVYSIGSRVRITQMVAARHYAFLAPVEGIVIDSQRRPTGSWFAHGEADKLWLDRIVLRKDDGEVSTLNLDEHSRLEVLGD